jgi:DNA replication protein
MAIDGKLLARARASLEERRDENLRQHEVRRGEIYKKIPEIKNIESQLRMLMPGVIDAALSKDGAAEKVRMIQNRSMDLQMRRAELLSKNGYPADYLERIQSCTKCGDSGYVKGLPCSCLMCQYEQELASELSDLFKLGDESFETFNLNYYSTKRDLQTGVSPRECMEDVHGICLDYAECFGNKSENLLFQGGTGLGKTFLAACIARVVARRGFSVVYDTAVSALVTFEAEKFGKDGASPEQVRRLTECDLLILDDLGTELTSSFALSALYTLINSRLTSKKKTIITTNLSYDELRRRYTAQICSRLEGEYLNLIFTGSDIRALKKDQSL